MKRKVPHNNLNKLSQTYNTESTQRILKFSLLKELDQSSMKSIKNEESTTFVGNVFEVFGLAFVGDEYKRSRKEF